MRKIIEDRILVEMRCKIYNNNNNKETDKGQLVQNNNI